MLTFFPDVKKVRKRKMRSFKLGLSRPKSNKQESKPLETTSESALDTSEVDEINVSRDTIEDISDLHLKRAVKIEPETILDESIHSNSVEMTSNVNIVNKLMEKCDNSQPNAAKIYDLGKNIQPTAGPSNWNGNNTFKQKFDDSINDIDSSPECNKLGIMSFYDTSKLFDLSLENYSDAHYNADKYDNVSNHYSPVDIEIKAPSQIKMEIDTTTKDLPNENKRNVTLIDYNYSKILTPRMKPPTKSYVMATLKQYNIPKTKNPEPYYSDHKDVGDKVEIGQILLKVNSKLSRDQKPFEKVLDATNIEEWRHLIFLQTNEMSQESSKPDNLKLILAGNKKNILEPIRKPPTKKQIMKWLEQRNHDTKDETNNTNNVDISTNIDDLENSQALGLADINNSISLETDDKDKTNLNTSLQVSMQPDGSFLCFGSNDNRLDSNTIETPVVDVSI